MQINQISARLALDTTAMQSLFDGSFTGIQSIELKFLTTVSGTANFAIFENGVEKVSERVTSNGSVFWAATQPNSILAFYVNYYDAADLPQAFAIITI
jgi:hypothetical protein